MEKWYVGNSDTPLELAVFITTTVKSKRLSNFIIRNGGDKGDPKPSVVLWDTRESGTEHSIIREDK